VPADGIGYLPPPPSPPPSAPPLVFTVVVTTTPSSVTATDSAAFGAAVQASAEQQVPADEQASTVVTTQIDEVKTIVVDKGSLNMASGPDRVLLVMTCQNAVCDGMDGTCYVTLVERRNRALQSSNTATLSSTRSYQYTTSANASVPMQQMVAGPLATIGSSVTSVSNTQLSASTTVTASGTPSSSAVPQAFQTPTVMNSQLSLRLPSVGTTVSTPVVVRPPYPPPPPPVPPPSMSPSPPGQGSSGGPTIVYINNGTTVTIVQNNTNNIATSSPVGTSSSSGGGDTILSYGFGLATGLAAVACFLIGFIVASRYRNRRAAKGNNQVVPHSLNEPPPQPVAQAGPVSYESSDDDEPARPTLSRVPTSTLAARAQNEVSAGVSGSEYPAEPPPRADLPPPQQSLPSNLLGNILGETSAAAPGFDTSSAATPPSVQRSNTGRLVVAPVAGGDALGGMPNRSAPKLVGSASMASGLTAQQANGAVDERSLASSASAYGMNYGMKRPSGALLASARLAQAGRMSGTPETSTRPSSAKLPPIIGGVSVADANLPPRPSSGGRPAEGSVRLSRESVDSHASNDSKPPSRMAPQLAKQAWQRGSIKVNSARAIDISRSRTMFDDGRFLRSVVDEARTEGLTPARAAPPSPDGSQAPAPTQMLRKMTSKGLAREPETSEMAGGFGGGGGVRLHPPHLDEALAIDLAECFVPVGGTQPARSAPAPGAGSQWVKGQGPGAL